MSLAMTFKTYSSTQCRPCSTRSATPWIAFLWPCCLRQSHHKCIRFCDQVAMDCSSSSFSTTLDRKHYRRFLSALLSNVGVFVWITSALCGFWAEK